jgi:hypothetical protein
MRRRRVPGTLKRAAWTTVYECRGCGEKVIHVELSTADDEPLGIPLAMLVCDCGGIRQAAS